MNPSATLAATTFIEALAKALEAAGAYNKQDHAAPVAVLWPDKERQWEPLLPLLRERIPVFALGSYAPEEQSGPAYWLRCIIAHTISHPALEPGTVPILYLPGYSRQEVRAIASAPRELHPLAELQFRGILWAQKNGRDWTISAFLQNEDEGLGVEVANDGTTREALKRSLLRLADEPLESLRREAPLRAPFLDGLLHPDEVKNVLRWLDDPKGFGASSSPEEWQAFIALCESRYGFHPEKDGPITAARLMGQRDGTWGNVWRRFAEAPAIYKAVPSLLRQARPKKSLPMLDYAESWPQKNEEDEKALRESLGKLGALDANAARASILELEQAHGHRRLWVWASLGQAPLARSLEHIVALAKATGHSLAGSSVSEVVSSYADGGWRADLAMLDALAAVEATEDVGAVRVVSRTIYRPWLEACAEALQKAAARGETASDYAAQPVQDVAPRTCVLFTDGLRYDLAQRLAVMLKSRGFECSVEAGLAALPTVTGTAKPAVSPAAAAFVGGTGNGLEPVLRASGAKANVEVLRKALGEMGFQVLRDDELGDPSGQAWSELGDIDAYGHQHGWRVAHHAAAELRAIERRIGELLGHGWQKVVVVTDHGWLLLPGELPKANLPEHLTEVRKGRCARLKVGTNTEQQVVPWHWDDAVRIAIAPGIHCYEAGKEYEHGGMSPQECVVPVLTVTRPGQGAQPITIESVNWRRLRCTIVLSEFAPSVLVDLRTKAGDPASSLAGGGKEANPDRSAALFVADEDYEGRAAIVVVVGPDGSIRAQTSTIVGGP